jgi:3-phenylpropionate/trans-cinnamate dioxygenase ferredoxin subunit
LAFDVFAKNDGLDMSSAADIPIITMELFTKFQARFYADPVDGIIAVLGFYRRVVDLDGTQIIVFNLYGEYYAIEGVSTHYGGQLSGGSVDYDKIICPRYAARFCIRTGVALSASAYEPTITFPVRMKKMA